MLRRRRRHHFWFALVLFLCQTLVRQFYFYPAERKHGHPDKLFQYCSTDIDSLVQRQIRVRFQNISHLSLLIALFSLMESVTFVRPMTLPEVPTSLAWTIWAKTMMKPMRTTLQLPRIYVMMA
jgi:hypothetical protein